MPLDRPQEQEIGLGRALPEIEGTRIDRPDRKTFGELRQGDVISWAGSPGALVTRRTMDEAGITRVVTIVWLSTGEHYGERFESDLSWDPVVPVNLVRY